MDDQDGIDIESLRVDPELMQRVLEQQARKSTRKGWRRICTVVPRAWELRLLEASRISTYRLAHELLYLHWYGKGAPDHRFRQGGKSGQALRPIERKCTRRIGRAGPDRGGAQAAQGAACCPAPHPNTQN